MNFMNCLRLQPEVADQQGRLQPKKERCKFRSASAKAIWIKAAFLYFGLSLQTQPIPPAEAGGNS